MIFQFFKYSTVGVFSNAVAYLCYLSLTYLGVAPKVAMSLLYVVAAFFSYFGNRKLTFTYNGSLLNSGSRYFLSHLCGYIINYIFLVVFVDVLSFPHQLVQAVAIVFVAIFTFIALKFFVFRVDY